MIVTATVDGSSAVTVMKVVTATVGWDVTVLVRVLIFVFGRVVVCVTTTAVIATTVFRGIWRVVVGVMVPPITWVVRIVVEYVVLGTARILVVPYPVVQSDVENVKSHHAVESNKARIARSRVYMMATMVIPMSVILSKV